MGWLIDLAKAAIPEPMPGTGASPEPSAPDRLLSLPAKAEAHRQKALAMTDQAADLREAFEERAGILEYDAGLPRAETELEAARITATLARNRGYPWAALRAALADYPDLLSQLPVRAGAVDALPLSA